MSYWKDQTDRRIDSLQEDIKHLKSTIDAKSVSAAQSRARLSERIDRLEWTGNDQVVETPSGFVTLPASEHPCDTPSTGPFPVGSVFECSVCGDKWEVVRRFVTDSIRDYGPVSEWVRLVTPVDTTTEPQ